MLDFLGKIFNRKAWAGALPMLMIAAGVVCISFAYIAFPEADHPIIHGTLRTVGQSILVGGVVGVLLDTFKYIGIFTDAIH